MRVLASLYLRCWICLALLGAPVVVVAQDEPEEVKLRVSGVGSRLEENIRAHVGTLYVRDLDNSASLRSSVGTATQQALQALGYYDSEVAVQIRRDRDPADVAVRVRLAKPVRWRAIAVEVEGEGQDDPQLQQVLAEYLPKSGTVLDQGAYETLKRRLQTTAISRGYFDAAHREHRIEIDRDERSADLYLTFDSARRYRLAEVTFSETELSDERLNQLVPFDAGDPYSEDRINHLNKRLLDSGYFASVTVRPQRPENADQPIPVDVLLRDNESNRVGVGVGYGTDSGPRFRLSWDKPLINSAGHSFSSSLIWSEMNRRLSAEYRIPESDPINDFWTIQAGYQEEEFEDSYYRTESLGFSRQTLLSSGWWRNPSLRIRSESASLGGGSGEDERVENSLFVVPGISFSKTSTEGGVHPDRGYRLLFDTEFSDPILGSDTRYLRLKSQAHYLLSLAPRHQLLSRVELGWLMAEDFHEVPVSTRFFAGGDQSVRGYDYNSLGPRRPDGTETGGQYLTTVSGEYLYRIFTNWQAAVFVDHGGAFANCCAPRFTGVGVGARWLLPFGNFRLDVAHGMEGGGVRLHLFVGGVL